MRIITPILYGVNDGGMQMIVFDNLWVLMKEKGVSTYQLREKCGIDSKTSPTANAQYSNTFKVNPFVGRKEIYGSTEIFRINVR